VPVDGALCRLGGASASALRTALGADERDGELEYVEHELSQIRPLAHPEARVIDGVARWTKLVISAAYPHNVNDAMFSAQDCARMIRAAVPVAITAAAAAGISSLAATVIGTAYRMPADLAIRAFLDGIAMSSARVVVRWSLPDPLHHALALDSATRLGLH
jgi:hypothetical protein